jgi:hypothetical protein
MRERIADVKIGLNLLGYNTKAACPRLGYIYADQILSLIREKIEKGLLTDDEINSELIKYAIEICESNPIRYWNHTEVIRRITQAQLQKILSLLK